MIMSNQLRSWLPNYLFAALIWGSSFYFIEVLLAVFHPTVVALLRLTIGAVVLLTISYLMKLKLPFAIWRKLFIAGLFMNSIPGFLFAFAQDYVSSILAGILNAATPLMTLLFIVFIFKDQKVSKNQVFGLLIGFAGVMIVLGVWTGLPSGQLVGVLAIICATAGYGFSLPYYRKNIIPLNYPPTAVMALQVAISTLQILPFALFNSSLRAEFTWHIGFSALMLGGLGSGVAYVMHYQVTKVAGAAIASSVTYLTPIVAAVAGVMLLNENLHWYEFAGALVVVIGILISQRQRR